MGETPITNPQLKRLQTLMGKICARDGAPKPSWRTYRLAWVGRRLALPDLASFSDLTKAQAKAALEAIQIELPASDLRRSRRRGGHASGTAGRKNRQGDPAVIVSAASLELLGTLKAALGWNQVRFEAFTRRQLRGRATISTEADANRVIWPLKRILRAGRETGVPGNANLTIGGDAGISACSGCPGPLEDEDRPPDEGASQVDGESSLGKELSGDPHGRDEQEIVEEAPHEA
jgi:hypothetical protein